jgi:hypothetical protein
MTMPHWQAPLPGASGGKQDSSRWRRAVAAVAVPLRVSDGHDVILSPECNAGTPSNAHTDTTLFHTSHSRDKSPLKAIPVLCTAAASGRLVATGSDCVSKQLARTYCCAMYPPKIMESHCPLFPLRVCAPPSRQCRTGLAG